MDGRERRQAESCETKHAAYLLGRAHEHHDRHEEIIGLKAKVLRLEARGIEDMQHEIERLREALAPLAAVASVVSPPAGCDPAEVGLFVRTSNNAPTHRITLADALKASAALRGEEAP